MKWLEKRKCETHKIDVSLDSLTDVLPVKLLSSGAIPEEDEVGEDVVSDAPTKPNGQQLQLF